MNILNRLTNLADKVFCYGHFAYRIIFLGKLEWHFTQMKWNLIFFLLNKETNIMERNDQTTCLHFHRHWPWCQLFFFVYPNAFPSVYNAIYDLSISLSMNLNWPIFASGANKHYTVWMGKNEDFVDYLYISQDLLWDFRKWDW